MIRIVHTPRQTGKTTALIRLSGQTGCYIICPTSDRAEHIARLAHDLGERIPSPLTWHEFATGQFCPPNIHGFVIDDLDACLRQMARGVPIHAATLTDEAKNPQNFLSCPGCGAQFTPYTWEHHRPDCPHPDYPYAI